MTQLNIVYILWFIEDGKTYRGQFNTLAGLDHALMLGEYMGRTTVLGVQIIRPITW